MLSEDRDITYFVKREQPLRKALEADSNYLFPIRDSNPLTMSTSASMDKQHFWTVEYFLSGMMLLSGITISIL